MAYTVKQLAKMSGVSVRTLHWYDEKGLLKPASYGINGYRYYEEEQALFLQQILFFRELGFKLDDIQKLLSQDDFDKVKALQAHKRILKEEINRKTKLLATVDKTIDHLKGKQAMTPKDFYHGFDKAKQKEYEQYLVTYRGMEAENLLKDSKKRTATWDGDKWEEVKTQGDLIHKQLAAAIEAGLNPEDQEVQAIIHRHYQLYGQFYHMTKEIYQELPTLYAKHPDFRKFFDVYHPKLIEFLGKAMRYYAEENL